MSAISLRAIPSTIAQKSTPTIPPASQAFEPFTKGVLQKRFTRNVLVTAAAVCWGQSLVSVVYGLGGPGAFSFTGLLTVWISPIVLAVAASYWTFGALPAVVSRKISMSASRAVSTSPSKTIATTFSRPTSRTSLIIYIASSLSLTLLHVAVEYMTGHDTKLSIFVKSKKHPYYLNGRLIFLLLSQLALALVHFSRNALTDRFVFRWNAPKAGKSIQVLSVAVAVALVPLVSLPLTIATFGLVRALLPLVFKLPILHLFLRPFIYHFTRGYVFLQPWNHIPLLTRAWGLAIATLTTWEVAEGSFDSQISQPIPCSHLSEVDLVAGAASTDRIFQFFAFQELQALASSMDAASAARRSSLFADQKHSPNMWSQLLRSSLVLLGTDYQHLLRRGQPAPPPAAPAPVAPSATTTALSATPMKVGLKPIYKPSSSDRSPLRQVINSLGSDGNIPRAVDEVGRSDFVRKVEEKVEESAAPAVAAVVPSTNGKGIVDTSRDAAKDILMRIKQQIPGIEHVGAAVSGCTKWYTTARIDKEAEMVLYMREIDLVVVDVISHLTCASLKEDTFGVVQRDIPRILESFVSFLEAAEVYRAEILAREGGDDETEKAKAKDVVDEFCEGLRTGIRRVVQTFGSKLTAFKFPPRVAGRLQDFVDYM